MLKPDVLDDLVLVEDCDCIETYPAIGDGFTLLAVRDEAGQIDVEIRLPAHWVTAEVADRLLAFAREQRKTHAPRVRTIHLHR